MKALRGLVNFDYDLRKKLAPASKGKINKYYRELQEAKGQPSRVYRTRDKNKLRAVQKASGQQLSGFTVAIIPNYDPENKYTPIYKDGQVIFSSRYEDKIFYGFDKNKLATDTENHLQEKLDKIPEERIGIMCGKFEYSNRTMNKADAKETAINMINAYNGISDNGQLANNHYKNWLEGFFGIVIKNQKQYNSAMAKKGTFKALTKAQRIKYLKGELNGKKSKAKNRNG